MNHHWLQADWEPGLSITHLPHQHFLEREIKALILDVERTLLPGKEVILLKSVKDWVKEARRNLIIHLLSNNPSKTRIEAVANQLDIPFTYGAAKPRSKALRHVIDQLQLNPIHYCVDL